MSSRRTGKGKGNGMAEDADQENAKTGEQDQQDG